MQYVLGNMLNGGGINPDGLSLDLQFATDKTLTARKGPTPTFTRASTATFVGSDGLIQSAAINAARFDHDPVTLACKGLLIEEGRTNLAPQSQNFASGSWDGDATTKTSGLGGGLDGSPTVGQFSRDSITGFSINYPRNTSVNFSSGVTYTVSAWLALGSGSPTVKFSYYNGGWITSSALALTTTLTRYTWTVTAAGTPSLGVGLEISTSTPYGVKIWGFQIEAGSFATSYIPTTTGTLARSADVCSITGTDFGGFYNQSEGSFYVKSFISAQSAATDPFFLSFYNPSLNEWGARIFSSKVQITQRDGLQKDIDAANFVVGSVSAAATYNSLGSAASAYGLPAVGGLAPNFIGFNALDIGRRRGGALPTNGHIASIRYYRKRLSNEKLVTLTTP
jgi:hypothetical protein